MQGVTNDNPGAKHKKAILHGAREKNPRARPGEKLKRSMKHSKMKKEQGAIEKAKKEQA